MTLVRAIHDAIPNEETKRMVDLGFGDRIGVLEEDGELTLFVDVKIGENEVRTIAVNSHSLGQEDAEE